MTSNIKPGLKRRDFLKCSGILATYFLLGRTAKAVQAIQQSVTGSYLGPFIKNPSIVQTDFDGDNPDFPHEVLWNKAGYIAKFKTATTKPATRILIVGGGMGGLSAAYHLQDQQVTLLEQAPQLGGNSKGYEFSDGPKSSFASIGAAYITIPDEGSTIDLFLKDLNLNQQGRREETMPLFFQNKAAHDFKDILSAKDKEIYEKISARLSDILENSFPDIPLSQDAAAAADVLKLDQITFIDWLTQEFGKIPQPILEYYQLYGWSSFGGSIDEISAAQFINFVSAETLGVWAFPGGNAQIIESVYQKIKNKINIQCGAFVANIEKTATGFKTQYIKDNQLFEIESDYLIFAAPKFLADKVFSADFVEITKACESIEYRSYLVANIMLKNKITLPGYDQFVLDGVMPPSPAAMKPSARAFPDIVNADWAASLDNESQMMTAYRPLPYQGARQFLFNPAAYEKHKNVILTGLSNLGIRKDQIEYVNLTRWGHAIPVARKGMLSSEVLKPLYPTAGQKLYFVGQDVYANPAFEAAFETALSAAEYIKKQI